MSGTCNFQDSSAIRRTADQLLSQGHAQPIYELLAQQLNKSEALMQDNALLQRSIYKYETTFAEMDNAFRCDDQKDQVILELKQLTEKQLSEIVGMQREIELARKAPIAATPASGTDQLYFKAEL